MPIRICLVSLTEVARPVLGDGIEANSKNDKNSQWTPRIKVFTAEEA